METMTTRNVSDIPADERIALEHLLGTPLTNEQQVFVGAFTSGRSDPASRASARDRLTKTFAAQATRAAREGISDEEADAAVDEAMRHIRPRPE